MQSSSFKDTIKKLFFAFGEVMGVVVVTGYICQNIQGEAVNMSNVIQLGSTYIPRGVDWVQISHT